MGKDKQSILFVDNRTSFLKVQASLLEDAGYQVFKAESIARADQLLYEKQVNLIISDIRMEDDDDPEDASGLLWVQQEQYRPMPIIVLTAYPEEYVRTVLEAVLDDRANIIGFVNKGDGPNALHAALTKAFTERIDINWGLVIRLHPTYSTIRLINLIEPDLPLPLWGDRGTEVEDTLRQLFHRYEQITLGHIIAAEPGHVIFETFAYDEMGRETQYIVSFGERMIITDENKRSEAIPKGHGKGSTRWASELSTVETLRFAASAYLLVDGDLERMTSFSTFYRYHNAQANIQALEHLYGTTLAAWYESGLSRNQYCLSDFVPEIQLNKAASADSFTEKIEALCEETLTAGVARLKYTEQQLQLQIAENAPIFYRNFTQESLAALPAQQVICGAVHGCVNGHSVRIDHDSTTWLINFSKAGKGVLLRDFAYLETHIKLDWLRSMSVADRYLLEGRLLSEEKLGESEDTEALPIEVAKALAVISHLRRLAARYLGPDPKPYLLGLCAYSLSYFDSFDPTVRYRKSELEPYTHALLSAAMIQNNLAMQTEPGQQLPPQAHQGLWLDKTNESVWVKGQEISLTQQEYALLAYLEQNTNQLCTRDNIAHQVWEEEKEPVWSKNRLDTLVGRVRNKVEVNPRQPKYLITVRGRGYKLEL